MFFNNFLLVESEITTSIKIVFSILTRYAYFLKFNIPFFLVKIAIFGETLRIFIRQQRLRALLFFLQNHTFAQFSTLADFTAVDTMFFTRRFTVFYFLLNALYSNRLILYTKVDEVFGTHSMVPLFCNADWLEREVWDLFGVRFIDHPDLRRLLNDYGFAGHPLRKDFPLTGYTEVLFSDTKKTILYNCTSLSQEYRLFEFRSPWSKS